MFCGRNNDTFVNIHYLMMSQIKEESVRETAVIYEENPGEEKF
jgi:hypothetical protein